MTTIYLCDRQPYDECPCPWKSCNECQPEIINTEEEHTVSANREVFGKNGDKVVVMDVRDLLHGEYSVERLVYGGYQTVYTSKSLEKCIAKAKELLES